MYVHDIACAGHRAITAFTQLQLALTIPFLARMPRSLSRARELVISSARKPSDPNEETLHWLRCVELGKTVYAPRFRVSELFFFPEVMP